MYKTCSRCMKVVPEEHICPYKKDRRIKESSQIRRFRNSKGWINKSIEIRERDRYLCQVCINNLYYTINTYNYNKLSVHHIISLEKDFTKRLDNDNLITLCDYHHKLAEKGEIPVKELQELIK